MKSDFKTKLLDILRILIISLTTTFLGILAFAIFVKYVGITDKGIIIFNTVLKVISILLGILFGMKTTNKGYILGGVTSFTYIIITMLIFSFLSKIDNINFSIYDVFLGIISGAISGIIKVNLKKE